MPTRLSAASSIRLEAVLPAFYRFPGMGIRVRKRRSRFRSALSIVAIYALVMQSILAGLVAAQAAQSADADPAICLSHADGRAAPQNAPDDHSDCLQCMICASGPLTVALAESILSEGSPQAIIVSWQGEAWRAPAFLKNSNAQPRGPPLVA
jgi:hypothetical protein